VTSCSESGLSLKPVGTLWIARTASDIALLPESETTGFGAREFDDLTLSAVNNVDITKALKA
jgi:hypothetical protein